MAQKTKVQTLRGFFCDLNTVIASLDRVSGCRLAEGTAGVAQRRRLSAGLPADAQMSLRDSSATRHPVSGNPERINYDVFTQDSGLNHVIEYEVCRTN